MTEMMGKTTSDSFSPRLNTILFRLDFSQLPENIKEYIGRLQNDVQSLQTQLTNLTAVVDFADSTKLAEIEDLKQRHQQELATIQILMEGQTISFSAPRIRTVFPVYVETIRDQVGDARARYDNELTNVRRKFESLQQENYELKSRVADEK